VVGRTSTEGFLAVVCVRVNHLVGRACLAGLNHLLPQLNDERNADSCRLLIATKHWIVPPSNASCKVSTAEFARLKNDGLDNRKVLTIS